MTIVRIWRGITLAARAGEYLEYLNKTVIPSCQMADNHERLFIMKDLQGELAHFLLLSFWTSNEELESSAGTDSCECEVVNPPPEEKSLLIAFESIARYYEVVYTSESPLLDKNMR